MPNQIPFLFNRVLNIKNSLFFKLSLKKRIRDEVEKKIDKIKERIKDYEEVIFLLEKEDEEIIDIISSWYLSVIKYKKRYKIKETVVEKILKD